MNGILRNVTWSWPLASTCMCTLVCVSERTHIHTHKSPCPYTHIQTCILAYSYTWVYTQFVLARLWIIFYIEIIVSHFTDGEAEEKLQVYWLCTAVTGIKPRGFPHAKHILLSDSLCLNFLFWFPSPANVIEPMSKYKKLIQVRTGVCFIIVLTSSCCVTCSGKTQTNVYSSQQEYQL